MKESISPKFLIVIVLLVLGYLLFMEWRSDPRNGQVEYHSNVVQKSDEKPK